MSAATASLYGMLKCSEGRTNAGASARVSELQPAPCQHNAVSVAHNVLLHFASSRNEILVVGALRAGEVAFLSRQAANQLLCMLEAAASQLSPFSAIVSHDLRTSITVILATARLSLRRHRTEQEYCDDLDCIATECRTNSTLLEALLSLARSDNFIWAH